MPLKYLNRNNNSSVISAGNSVLFNGSNYLSVPTSSVFTLGTNNHTIEFWIYQTSRGTYDVSWDYGSSTLFASNTYYMNIGSAGCNLLLGNGSGGWGVNISKSLPTLNAWHHVAIVRNSNIFTLYIDGVGTSATYAANISAQALTMKIGSDYGTNRITGYISNFRFINGTAVYTGDFIPQTSPLTAIVNTSLLTCNAATIVDSSTNNFTITNNGSATVSATVPFTASISPAPSGVRFLNRSNTPLTGTQKAIFGYGYPGNVTNLVSNTGVVANDTVGVGAWRAELAAASYGTDKAIFGYGAGANYYSLTNLVSNTGVVANDTAGVGTARQSLAAAAYGNDKAIFGYGHDGAYYSITNKVSNTGVVSTNTTGIGTTRRYIAAAGYGIDKAIFGYGYNGTVDVSMTNLVSNTGVVATDTAGVGTARGALGAACYGVDKAIFGYGSGTIINLVSNTGVVATDTAGAGTGRGGVAAASYNIDKAIFGYGYTTTFASMTNLVSNTGVVATDTTGVGTARYLLAAAGYSTSAPVIISTMRVSKIYADPAALITNGLVLNLDAGNTNSYPGSGTSWYNLNGNNTGSLINGPTYNNANGGSIVFDGSNDYVSIPNSSSLNPANITVSAWINRAGAVYYSHFIGLPVSDSAWSPPYMSYGIEYIGTTDVMSFSLGFSDSSFAYTNATAFGNNQWFQFIGTYDGTNVKVYLNGAIQTTRAETKTMAASSANFYIGSNNTSTGYPLNGKIGSVQVYNRALSASEVLQNYDVTKTRFGL